MTDLISVSVEDGKYKYTIQQVVRDKWECLISDSSRVGRRAGLDKLHVACAYEIDKLRREVATMSKPEGSFMWALHNMLWNQKDAFREAEPHIKYIFDGAEGCAFWSMNSETDDLEQHAFTCAQIIADDWRLVAPSNLPEKITREWKMAINDSSVLIYCLKQDGYRKGEPVMVNDLTIRIENGSGSENDLKKVATGIMYYLNSGAELLKDHFNPNEIADLRMKLAYWQRGTDIVGQRLAECIKADPSNAAFPLVGNDAKRWHAYRGEAYRDALEMMGVPEDFGPVLKGDV